MKSISIFGLGYVGTVTAACLASRGHRIIGVDLSLGKVECIRAGTSPIVEAGVEEKLAAASRDGLICGTQSAAEAVAQSDISFISVGTPGQRNGRLDLSYVRNVAVEIGQALRQKNSFHWIVLRSTVLPGTTEQVVIPAIETASGRTSGRDFIVCANPEFLREGTAVKDFFRPPFTIIGTDDPVLAAPIIELYDFLPSELFKVPIRAAEMVKYCCNAFHALKVAFSNEIGTICSTLDIDSGLVAHIFKTDTRLNISTAYLNPGFAFGGSCLPKDLRALTHRVKELDLNLPLLDAILPSNLEHIDRAAEAILSLGRRNVAILGLSFKAGTDDLRESPMVALVKKLIAEGCHVRIWDKNVSLGWLIGSNRQFITEQIPHIGTLLHDDINDVLAHSDLIVTASDEVAHGELISTLHEGQYFINLGDLNGIVTSRRTLTAGA